jgi:hypothetical protein
MKVSKRWLRVVLSLPGMAFLLVAPALRGEAFSVFHHANFVGFSGTWGNEVTPGSGFGEPLSGITNQLPAREMQFSARVSF